jgi:hypothetical protein
LIDWLFGIFRHTQQFFSYMMTASYHWWKREPRYNYTMHLGRDHRPSASNLTNFLTQSHRSEQDSNRRHSYWDFPIAGERLQIYICV